MDTEKLLQRASIILPVAHIAMCTLYLSSLCYGFGSQLYSAISVSNFFTITLSRLAAMYIGALIIPAIILTAIDNFSPNIAPSNKPIHVIITNPKLYMQYFGGFLIPVILSVAVLIFGYLDGAYLPAQIWASLITSYLYPLYLLWYDRTNAPRNLRGASFLPILVAIMIVAIGYDDGMRYRHRSFEDLSQDRMFCKSHTVLFGVGDGYLTVTKDNRRQLIDRECRDQFTFEDTYVLKEIPALRRLDGLK